ncbi:alpha/beta hydrolase [Pseudonocardia endophytica]|uniref:Acetyl esterase/lipase n=1 Tax=Pseudonocardia endophytica TaxID=401976 RepID=A0A4R1HG39_PSEEN|nr:alpha/beta hydrolase [Pseudonocardia endophytica]TCK20658.1 acetyl esterase/lipase [Pseudonocardia endophytica]
MTDTLDPALRRARMLPRAAVGPRTLPLVRGLMGLALRRTGADSVVTLAGGARVHVYRPAGAPRGGLLWIHGGGFVIGSPIQDDPWCRELADRYRLVVASVDYRLAPEHPFPAPLEDCYAGLAWLAGRADVDADRIVVGGASAGGGLAASLAILARDRGEIRPVLQLLSYPMVDDRTTLRTDLDDGASYRMWNARSNRYGWRCYLGTDSSGDVPALAAPARVEDLSGVAPAWIGVGTCDLFHDEDLAYAARLREAGVDISLHVSPGAYHGFDGVEPDVPVSRAFTEARHAALADVMDAA